MAPAFLLVAITNFLGLITASRQRVMERYRQLLAAPDPLIGPQALDYETAVLRQRISLTTRSIGMLTLIGDADRPGDLSYVCQPDHPRN